MSGNLEPDFVESRKRALEQYLQDLIADPIAIGSQEFRSFMDANRGYGVRLSEELGAPSDSAGPSGSAGGGGTSKARLQRKVPPVLLQLILPCAARIFPSVSWPFSRGARAAPFPRSFARAQRRRTSFGRGALCHA
jgi:hypothetical protein